MNAKLYVLTLAASQFENMTFTAGASTVLTVQQSEQEAYTEAVKQVHVKFPVTEGWTEHQVNVFEVPASFDTDNYHVTWAITSL